MYVYKKSFNRVLGFACIGLWLLGGTCLGADDISRGSLDLSYEFIQKIISKHAALATAWGEAKAAGKTACLSSEIRDCVDQLANLEIRSPSKEEVAPLNKEVVETICSQKSSRSVASFSPEEARNFSTYDLEALLEDSMEECSLNESAKFITPDVVRSLLSPQVQKAQEIAKALASCPNVQKAYSEYAESMPGLSAVFMEAEVWKTTVMVEVFRARDNLTSARSISLQEFRMVKASIMTYAVKEIEAMRGRISPHTASGGSSSSESLRD